MVERGQDGVKNLLRNAAAKTLGSLIEVLERAYCAVDGHYWTLYMGGR